MVRRKSLAAMLLFVVTALRITICGSAANAESFDKPLQEKVIDLGRSQYLMRSDNSHVKLTCSYYPKFMVKQLDDPGNKGALWIAIVPSRPGHIAGCTRRHAPEDMVFKNWDGYFGGVKRDLVFLYDSDGTNGGIGFAAFDSKTEAKIFSDSVRLGGRFDELDFVYVSDRQITLRYLRVVSGDCSVPKYASACWSKFQEQSGLRLAPIPTCDYHGEDLGVPSVIAYPVEVSLFPKPTTKAIGYPVKCWSPD
jgi:hypothetical protein